MNETMIEIGGALVVVALIFLWLGIRSHKKRKRIMEWPETEAKVVEDLGSYTEENYDSDKRSSSKWTVHKRRISFMVNDTVFEDEQDFGYPYKVGDKMTVKYDPNNPKNLYENYSSQSPWAKGIAQFIIAGALAAGGIIFFCLA